MRRDYVLEISTGSNNELTIDADWEWKLTVSLCYYAFKV